MIAAIDVPNPRAQRTTMQPDFISERDAQRLAQDDPAELARIIASGALRDTSLTFAAEHMGASVDAPLVARTLAPLLSHAVPVVREGAMIGLGMHPDSPEAVAVLRAHRDRETCPELASMLRCYLGECAPGCVCSPPAAIKLSPDAWAKFCELAGLNADGSAP